MATPRLGQGRRRRPAGTAAFPAFVSRVPTWLETSYGWPLRQFAARATSRAAPDWKLIAGYSELASALDLAGSRCTSLQRRGAPYIDTSAPWPIRRGRASGSRSTHSGIQGPSTGCDLLAERSDLRPLVGAVVVVKDTVTTAIQRLDVATRSTVITTCPQDGGNARGLRADCCMRWSDAAAGCSAGGPDIRFQVAPCSVLARRVDSDDVLGKRRAPQPGEARDPPNLSPRRSRGSS